MRTRINRRHNRAGYTLVEAAVAATVLLIAVGAACALSLTMITQEEIHVRVSRAVNLVENATRLYHLGIDTEVPSGSTDATVFSLLPPDPMVSGFTATAQTGAAMTGIGAPRAGLVRSHILPDCRSRRLAACHDQFLRHVGRPT